VSVLIGGLVIGLVAIALRRRRVWERQVADGAPTWSEAGLICSGMLLCGYHIGYDLLLLTWPAVALALRVRAMRGDTPVTQWLALGLIAVLAGNYLTSFAVIEALRGHLGLPPALSLALASLNGLALLLLFGVYLYEVMKARPATTAAESPPAVASPEGGPLSAILGTARSADTAT
jgi:hypothetical protein